MPRFTSNFWALDDTVIPDDFTDDRSNDYTERAMMPLASEARERNRTRRPFVAYCGHDGCGRKYRSVNAAARHAERCNEREEARYRFGR